MRKNANPVKRLVEKIASPKKPLEEVSGLYLGNNRYLHVVSQPSGKPEYVSSMSDVAPNFQLSSRYGNIGLIAHNYLAGKHFLDLKIGDVVHVMNGKRRTRLYHVTKIHQYQALNPRSPRSNFIDLENGNLCTAKELFKRVYMGKHHLVLQTCIRKGDIEEWGRQFVIADPIRYTPPSR